MIFYLRCGTSGVEEHEVTTRGAFNPHGKGQVTAAVFPQRVAVSTGRKAAIIHEHGQMTYSKRIRQAAHRAGFQAELLKRLPDLGQETLTPSHAPSYLRQTHPAVVQRFRPGVSEVLVDGEQVPGGPGTTMAPAVPVNAGGTGPAVSCVLPP